METEKSPDCPGNYSNEVAREENSSSNNKGI